MGNPKAMSRQPCPNGPSFVIPPQADCCRPYITVVLAQPQVSQRVQETDVPVIVHSRRVMSLRPGTLSLAQGIVHWAPPPAALEHASTIMQQQARGGSSAQSPTEQQQQMFATGSSVSRDCCSSPRNAACGSHNHQSHAAAMDLQLSSTKNASVVVWHAINSSHVLISA